VSLFVSFKLILHQSHRKRPDVWRRLAAIGQQLPVTSVWNGLLVKAHATRCGNLPSFSITRSQLYAGGELTPVL